MRTIFFYLLILSITTIAQEIDISSALRQVDSGNISSAETFLKELKTQKPHDPSVIFLDAVLTINGEEASKKYSTLYEKFPKSKYADAALFRLFSYHYSLGYYKKAESYLAKLKMEFPNSSYIKTADRKIPDVEEVVQITPDQKNDAVKFNFTIQAGAFLNIDNAKKLSEQFKADGYPSEITSKEIGGSILNVVNIGKFQKETDTKPTLEYLSKKFNLNGRVVNIIN